MPITQVGLVYYADDPTQSVFRWVYPSVDDSELDDPKHLTEGIAGVVRADGTQGVAVMVKVPVGSAGSGWSGGSVTPWSSVAQNVTALAMTAPAVVSAVNAASAASKVVALAKPPTAIQLTAATVAANAASTAIAKAVAAAQTAAKLSGATAVTILAAAHAATSGVSIP